jgi:NAD(P)-dependent dehydrogenase (short-subunit alcohol dehydrogenase family)
MTGGTARHEPTGRVDAQRLFGDQRGADRAYDDASIELGEYRIRANAILPGAVEGSRIQSVLEDRAKLSGRSVEEEKEAALITQSLKRFVNPRDIVASAVFLTSDARKSISGQTLPIDNDAQEAS